MSKKAENTFKMGYDPELDTSPELDSNAAFYYLTIKGILRWMIELGKIDTITKVLLLPSHVALPREKHLEAAVHVKSHVGQRYNSDWCIILHTQKLITVILKNVIDQSA